MRIPTTEVSDPVESDEPDTVESDVRDTVETEVPETVATALRDVTVEGKTCLEAGAGVGNVTAGLRAQSAAEVFAVSRDREHVVDARDRFGDDDTVELLQADLRSIPLPDDAVELVTAHALFNVVTLQEATAILEELTRVATPGARLVIDDYAPLPQGPVRDLFALENAVAELTESRPAYTFYPETQLEAACSRLGWHHERTTDLLDPVPWTAELLDAHANVVEHGLASTSEETAAGLSDRMEDVRERAGDGVDAGRMYSLKFRLPE